MEPAAEEELALRNLLAAPEDQLRAVLRGLCRDPAVRQMALQHYAAVQTGCAQLKRKVSTDLLVCVYCKSLFTEVDSVDGCCVYHPGTLEIDHDHDTWADCDWYFGDQDTEEKRRDFPEGFKWDCCGNDGTTRGCVSGKHETESSHGKQRLMDKSHAEYVVIDDDDEEDRGTRI